MSEPTILSTQTTCGLLSISGPDAKKFLQGQLTCNLDEITTTQSRLGAHCNPQGRVLFLFRIFNFQDHYYLVMPPEMVSQALGDLGKYAVFYKLALRDASNNESTELHQLAAKEWSYFSVSLGRPQVYKATSGKFLPHDLNLHQLEGISWDKGCYTGQEIIARMHYRGKLKNHLCRVRTTTTATPAPGIEINGSRSGLLVDCYQEASQVYQLLILVHEEEIGSASLTLDTDCNESWEWL